MRRVLTRPNAPFVNGFVEHRVQQLERDIRRDVAFGFCQVFMHSGRPRDA
jgi:hypothetical protein